MSLKCTSVQRLQVLSVRRKFFYYISHITGTGTIWYKVCELFKFIIQSSSSATQQARHSAEYTLGQWCLYKLQIYCILVQRIRIEQVLSYRMHVIIQTYRYNILTSLKSHIPLPGNSLSGGLSIEIGTGHSLNRMFPDGRDITSPRCVKIFCAFQYIGLLWPFKDYYYI